jgi:hypothetical protein
VQAGSLLLANSVGKLVGVYEASLNQQLSNLHFIIWHLPFFKNSL